MKTPTDAFEERFWSKVDKRGPNDCWEWQAAKIMGYGTFTMPGRKQARAHRVSYQLEKGDLREGLVLDHLCRNKACVNPAHLEQVTNRVNTLRGIGPCAVNALKTKCARGHEYVPGSYSFRVGTNRTKRDCLICRKRINQEYRARMKAKV